MFPLQRRHPAGDAHRFRRSDRRAKTTLSRGDRGSRWLTLARTIVACILLVIFSRRRWRRLDDASLEVGAKPSFTPRKMRGREMHECDKLATSWIDEQRGAHERRVRARDDDAQRRFLYFLHIPRTAGRSFHWCFLKPSFKDHELCGNQYTGLRIDPREPTCDFLATHDDYSLIERFTEQPRVVTMLRKPSARALSSYEFSIEVAARSFGKEPVNTTRVQTRDVWPWSVLTRFMDDELRSYDDAVNADGRNKLSISNVYDNALYTPFEDWAEMKMVHDDIHNGQFFQLLGLTNNTDDAVEPRAAELRECALWRGTKASKMMMDYAKERLEHEVDVLALHERLDESIELAARQLDLPLSANANFADPTQIDAQNVKSRISKVATSFKSDDASDCVDVVGFSFRFSKLKSEALKEASFRERYASVLEEGVSMRCGVDKSNVQIWPMDSDDDWTKNFEGFHIMTVAFTRRVDSQGGEDSAEASYDDVPESARALFAVLERHKAFETLIAPNVNTDETYGSFEVSAFGVFIDCKPDSGTTVKRSKNVRRNVGEQYRVCEANQFAKYKRLRKNALKHITDRIDGTYETFSSSGRKRISQRVIARVDELNFLDYELWAFANRLFDARVRAFARDDATEPLERLPRKDFDTSSAESGANEARNEAEVDDTAS